MILSDQMIVENNIEKKSRKIKLTGDKSEARQVDLLNQCLALLEAEKPLSELDLSAEDWKLLRGYGFLSVKPILIVINIKEDDLGRAGTIKAEAADYVVEGKCDVEVISGKLEMEAGRA